MDLFAIFISIGSSLIGIGVAWGVTKTMVSKLDEANKDLRSDVREIESRYVTHTHFTAVTEPIKDAIKEVQRDVKKILMIVSKN